jgi:hypothetical protein
MVSTGDRAVGDPMEDKIARLARDLGTDLNAEIPAQNAGDAADRLAASARLGPVRHMAAIASGRRDNAGNDTARASPRLATDPSGSVASLPSLASAATGGVRPGLDGGGDLRPLADQLIAIAEQLRSGVTAPADNPEPACIDTRPADPSSPQTAPTPAAAAAMGSAPPLPAAIALASLDRGERRAVFVEMARASYAKRRRRTTIFGDPDLFGEPGWDILLDLYIAHAEGKPVSVSSACIGSAAPPTTGLRWLGVLADQNLVEREHDPHDQRRVLVRLTEKALDAMDEYFAASAQIEDRVPNLTAGGALM